MRTFQDWKKDNLTRIKARAKSLRLKQLDVANAVDLLHAFFRQFFSYLNECPERPYFRDVRELMTGSSYEFGKVTRRGRVGGGSSQSLLGRQQQGKGEVGNESRKEG